MSYVTNAILSAHLQPAKKINAEIAQRDTRQQQFVLLNDKWTGYGGSKVLERDLWICAFNHFPKHKILDAIEAADVSGDGWDDGWQLIVCNEGEDFQIFGPGSYGEPVTAGCNRTQKDD